MAACTFTDRRRDGRRWTAGRTLIPAALRADVVGDFFLRLDLAQPALPSWLALAEAGVEATPVERHAELHLVA